MIPKACSVSSQTGLSLILGCCFLYYANLSSIAFFRIVMGQGRIQGYVSDQDWTAFSSVSLRGLINLVNTIKYRV